MRCSLCICQLLETRFIFDQSPPRPHHDWSHPDTILYTLFGRRQERLDPRTQVSSEMFRTESAASSPLHLQRFWISTRHCQVLFYLWGQEGLTLFLRFPSGVWVLGTGRFFFHVRVVWRNLRSVLRGIFILKVSPISDVIIVIMWKVHLS